jgi:hypothetical protein
MGTPGKETFSQHVLIFILRRFGTTALNFGKAKLMGRRTW